MDNTDLERERGITILAKNTAVHYHDILINIVDTPGHADFGGEVERTLSMVDGVMLLVDASEGPLPQTRFVLRKALERRLPPIVVINKIDRPDARPQEVLNEIYDLFIDLDADRGAARLSGALHERQGRHGEPRRRRRRAPTCGRCSTRSSSTCRRRAAIPTRRCSCWSPTSTRATTSAASPSAASSTAACKIGDPVAVCKLDAAVQETKVTKLYAFDGLKRIDIQEAAAGDIVCLAGIEDITIGETIADVEHRIAIPPIAIDEPTVSMIFGVNTSPMAGREGQYVTSRQLRDRLDRELLGNVSIRLEPTDSPEQVKVVGRGELQLSILIEMMRREGFELQVSRPDIVTKEIDGQIVEPVEELVIDVPEDHQGVVIAQVGERKGDDDQDGQQRQRPRAARVPDPGARADRLPLAVHDRHQGHRHHEPHLLELGAVARRDSRRAPTGALVADRPGSRPPTRSSTCRSAARSSSTRARRSTRA